MKNRTHHTFGNGKLDRAVTYDIIPVEKPTIEQSHTVLYLSKTYNRAVTYGIIPVEKPTIEQSHTILYLSKNLQNIEST